LVLIFICCRRAISDGPPRSRVLIFILGALSCRSELVRSCLVRSPLFPLRAISPPRSLVLIFMCSTRESSEGPPQDRASIFSWISRAQEYAKLRRGQTVATRSGRRLISEGPPRSLVLIFMCCTRHISVGPPRSLVLILMVRSCASDHPTARSMRATVGGLANTSTAADVATRSYAQRPRSTNTCS